MLTALDIQKIFDRLYQLNLGCHFGYAGSYARGQAKENSDLDILVEGTGTLSNDAYFMIYHTLEKLINIHFDIVDLAALEEDDRMMDKKLLEMGLNINTKSAYKTMMKDVVWVSNH